MVRLRSRLLVAEALVLALVARGMRRCVPMRRWAPLLGVRGPVTSPPVVGRLSGVEQRVAAAVARAHGRVASNCLEQAVAASLMLRFRRVRSVVVIGLDAEDPGGVPHAWLVGTSGHVVTGGGVDGYLPASQFGRLG